LFSRREIDCPHNDFDIYLDIATDGYLRVGDAQQVVIHGGLL